MSFEPYQVGHKTPAERGHGPNCKFVNYHGPRCDCDSMKPSDYTLMMIALGWDIDNRSRNPAFSRTMGPHYINVALVMSGWQYHWMRKEAMTIDEGRGFGTLGACLTHLWQRVAARVDVGLEAQVELVKKKALELASEESSG